MPTPHPNPTGTPLPPKRFISALATAPARVDLGNLGMSGSGSGSGSGDFADGELRKNFIEFKTRHSTQNRNIIKQNVDRSLEIKFLQDEITSLQIELLNERHEVLVLEGKVRRRDEELERLRGEVRSWGLGGGVGSGGLGEGEIEILKSLLTTLVTTTPHLPHLLHTLNNPLPPPSFLLEPPTSGSDSNPSSSRSTHSSLLSPHSAGNSPMKPQKRTRNNQNNRQSLPATATRTRSRGPEPASTPSSPTTTRNKPAVLLALGGRKSWKGYQGRRVLWRGGKRGVLGALGEGEGEGGEDREMRGYWGESREEVGGRVVKEEVPTETSPEIPSPAASPRIKTTKNTPTDTTEITPLIPVKTTRPAHRRQSGLFRPQPQVDDDDEAGDEVAAVPVQAVGKGKGKAKEEVKVVLPKSPPRSRMGERDITPPLQLSSASSAPKSPSVSPGEGVATRRSPRKRTVKQGSYAEVDEDAPIPTRAAAEQEKEKEREREVIVVDSPVKVPVAVAARRRRSVKPSEGLGLGMSFGNSAGAGSELGLLSVTSNAGGGSKLQPSTAEDVFESGVAPSTGTSRADKQNKAKPINVDADIDLVEVGLGDGDDAMIEEDELREEALLGLMGGREMIRAKGLGREVPMEGSSAITQGTNHVQTLIRMAKAANSTTTLPADMLPVLPLDEEEDVGGRHRRARKSVNYKEPNLHVKMRKPEDTTRTTTSSHHTYVSATPLSSSTARGRSTPATTPGKSHSSASTSSSSAHSNAAPIPPLSSALRGESGYDRDEGLGGDLFGQGGVRRKSVLPKSRRVESILEAETGRMSGGRDSPTYDQNDTSSRRQESTKSEAEPEKPSSRRRSRLATPESFDGNTPDRLPLQTINKASDPAAAVAAMHVKPEVVPVRRAPRRSTFQPPTA